MDCKVIIEFIEDCGSIIDRERTINFSCNYNYKFV